MILSQLNILSGSDEGQGTQVLDGQQSTIQWPYVYNREYCDGLCNSSKCKHIHTHTVQEVLRVIPVTLLTLCGELVDSTPSYQVCWTACQTGDLPRPRKRRWMPSQSLRPLKRLWTSVRYIHYVYTCMYMQLCHSSVIKNNFEAIWVMCYCHRRGWLHSV